MTSRFNIKTATTIGCNESWKPCLNLRSHKWLRPTSTLVTHLIPRWFSQLKTIWRVRLTNFRILLLRTLKLLTFQMLPSRAFHLITAEGKTNFWKSCFVLKRGMLSTFLVVHEEYLNRTNLKRYWVDSFFKSL